MKKCNNCIYFSEEKNNKGRCKVLEMLETLECCIENKDNECKILLAINSKVIYDE